MNKRLSEVDGLRALAVIGVTWAHCWMFFGNIDYYIYNIPINRILSFGGVGVDLFFVISGFCMTMAFTSKYKFLNFNNFKNFVSNRFLRIAPAYFFVLIIYSLNFYFLTNNIPIISLISHFAFVQTIFDLNFIGSHFWSLATEWHFYLLLPLIFIFGFNPKKIFVSTSVLIIICIFLRLFHWGYITESPLSILHSDFIYLRFSEFGWGILAFILYQKKYVLPFFFNYKFGFFVSIGISFLGRLLNSSGMIVFAGKFGFIVKAIAEPIMTFGFGLLVLNLISSKNIFSKVLCLKYIQFIGKISYSFYLWHWIVSYYTCAWSINFFGVGNLALQVSFIFSVIITIIIAYFSYNKIELVFYKSKN